MEFGRVLARPLSRRLNVFGIAPAMLLTAAVAARAFDEGIPGEATFSKPVVAATQPQALDPTPTGTVELPASKGLDPELPPDSAVAPNPAISSSTEDELPFALDQLLARKDAFAPLGPGDWRSAREAVRSLYVARNFRPVWTEGLALNVAGRALLDRLNRAGEDALSLSGIELPKESFWCILVAPGGED